MSVKLAPRSLFLIVLGVCALAVLCWYLLRYQARQQEISLLQGELETIRMNADRYRAAQRGLPELRQTVARLEVERDGFLRALPANAQFGTVLDEMRRSVLAAGAEMTTFNVQPGTATGLPAGVRPINLNLGVSGPFAAVFRALRSMETMNRFTTVGGVNLQLPQATSFNPRLEGTLNLTVYTFDPAQAASAPGGTGAAPSAPAAPPATPQGGTQ
ncbi:type IV pilus assembly protein PilO [Deinococcus aerius]|uniref:Type IV pilus assembly protein PilO n=1 Tax=Deinococcus aerius TaxID=200253 RepID=A0A2I9DJX5_9DEIO|nr:type 4a pilus biogenesis protein PilO [Deinococcus aerius]GBF05131.1 type IV pilus assembly protein PilO [Deinococcus aerius]